MKILVLSLLRLGDIIQQEPLLKGLREKHPSAEIHLLLNRQFASVERVLDSVVDKYIYFDRESLQKAWEKRPTIFYGLILKWKSWWKS